MFASLSVLRQEAAYCVLVVTFEQALSQPGFCRIAFLESRGSLRRASVSMLVNSRVHPRQAQISLSALQRGRSPFASHIGSRYSRTLRTSMRYLTPKVSPASSPGGSILEPFSVPIRRWLIACGGCRVESEADTNADRSGFQAFFYGRRRSVNARGIPARSGRAGPAMNSPASVARFATADSCPRPSSRTATPCAWSKRARSATMAR